MPLRQQRGQGWGRYPKKPLPPRQQRESPPAGLLDRTSSCLKAARLDPCPLTPRGAAAFAGPPGVTAHQ